MELFNFQSEKKLEIKKKKYLSSFCCHMVSFLLKTAIMQDSGCPYTSMKSGYEIVKKIYHQIQTATKNFPYEKN